MRAQTSSARGRKARPEARMPRALTLSVALAAIGLIAAAPASAAKDRKEVETRLKITGVSSTIESAAPAAPSAIYEVHGVVRSPRAECRGDRPKELIHHPSDWRAAAGEFRHFNLFWRERALPFTEEHDRVKVKRSPSRDGRFLCKADRSPRFTIPPPSEAGIAAAPASAAKERKKVETRVKITRVSSEIVSPDSGPPVAWYFVKGKVQSPRAVCRAGRRVTLTHHQTGRVYTNVRRFWFAWHDRTFRPTPQHVRVQVPRSPSYPDGRFICEGDRSPRFTIPPPSEVGVAAATASAAQDRKVVETRVKITGVSSEIVSPDFGAPYVQYSVRGRVHSPRAGCRVDRRVRLLHFKDAGFAGHFYTNFGGRYWLFWNRPTFPSTQQHDRVRVPRKPSYPDGRFICKADSSRFTIPPPSEAGIAAATKGES